MKHRTFPAILMLVLVASSLVLAGCAKDVLLINDAQEESGTFYLFVHNNLTNDYGTGELDIYLDQPGTETRTYFNVVGDDSP